MNLTIKVLNIKEKYFSKIFLDLSFSRKLNMKYGKKCKFIYGKSSFHCNVVSIKQELIIEYTF